jgi:malic enzyme
LLCCDGNNQFAAAAPLFHLARVSRGRLSERHHRIHDRMEMACVQQIANLELTVHDSARR